MKEETRKRWPVVVGVEFHRHIEAYDHQQAVNVAGLQTREALEAAGFSVQRITKVAPLI